jgi:hypothetical protein
MPVALAVWISVAGMLHYGYVLLVPGITSSAWVTLKLS